MGRGIPARSAAPPRDGMVELIAHNRNGAGEPAELLIELIHGLQTLSREYRDLPDTRCGELRQQLDAPKWRPFQDLANG